MKQIVRRVPTHTVRSFQCNVCETKYPTAKQAKKCEARIKEKKVFKKGDVVKGYEFHVCNHGKKDKNFQPKGTITMVIGPILPDYEYEVERLKGKPERLNGHIYLYEVVYACLCGRQRGYQYRTPEIFIVKK